MIECILGSLIGTLIGVGGCILYSEYVFKKELKELSKLIDEMNTFKIKFEDEI